MEIPLSKDAEEAVLCCCIIDDSNDSFHQISKDVSAEDFYYDDHKIIWDTIYEAENPERRLKSFLAKRIKGGYNSIA